jgi:tetratricopeptide (TPR) repeat protein
VGTGAESERYRMFDAAATFLRVIAHDAPVVLVLDDLHWADRPTLQLLQHVIRQAGDLPLLILGTYRDTDLVRTHPMAEVLSDLRRADLVERVALRGLSADDVIALVAARQTPDAADDELGRALWHETEGSPLFIRESLRHLAETGAVERDDDGRWRAHRRVAQLGIPEGVREVIGRRLTRLSDAANTALRVGSVLGRELRLDVLEAVTDLTSEQLLDALEEATTAGVIDELPGGKGRWTFTHALVRQSLYDELSMTRRLRMHQRIGEALEHLDGAGDGPHLAPLAHHFTQAAIAGFAAKAIEYEGRAGHYALTIGAYEESARHFAMGLEVAEDADAEPAVRADLLLCQAGAETRAGDARVARRTIERVVALIGTDDPARLATAAVTYAGAGARSLWVDAGAVNERSIALLEQALDALPDDDGELRARALSALGQALQFEPNAQTRRAALSADAVAMARRLGDPALLGDVLCDRFRAIWSPQTVTERITIACEVIAIATAVEDNRMLEAGHTQHAFVLLEVNDLAALRAAAAASEILIEGLRDPLGLELAEFRRGGMAIAEGRLDEAEAHVLEAFRRGQDTRDPNAFTMLAFATGTLRLIQGRAAEVMGAVLHLREFFPAIDFAAEAILAMVYADSGLHEQAVGLLTDLKLASPADVPDLMMLIAMHAAARAAFVAGDGTRARAMYELQLPYADLIVAAGPVPVCSTHLGVALAAAAAGDDEIAEEHFAAALAVHRGNGWRPWIAETQFFLALMVYRRGRVEDRDRVLALLDEVLVIATEVGMTSRAQEARAIRDELLGTGSDPAREGVALRRRDRAKARLSIRGRAAIASWTRGRDDDELARRFGASGAQRALFAATVRAFQPTMAFGFEGDIVYELRPPDDPADPAASDWWTIEVRGRKATAHRGRRAEAAVVIHAGLVDFVRLAAGEMHPAKALLDGLIDVEGDIMLAARLPDMFGSISPLDLSG